MIAAAPPGETAQDIGSVASNAELPDFSLVAGGPTYRLWYRFRLADAMLGLLPRRVLLAILITWLPLLLLGMLEGHAWNDVRLSFLRDASIHVRLLLAVPLLLAAEPVIHEWMRPLTNRFIERGIITGSSRPRFDAVADAHGFEAWCVPIAIHRTPRIDVSILGARLVTNVCWNEIDQPV